MTTVHYPSIQQKTQYWRNEVARLQGEIADASFRGDHKLAMHIIQQLDAARASLNRYLEILPTSEEQRKL